MISSSSLISLPSAYGLKLLADDEQIYLDVYEEIQNYPELKISIFCKFTQHVTSQALLAKSRFVFKGNGLS